MSDESDIASRQKKEKKELLAKIQGLKKAKVDKKKKKEILDEIVRLEEELEKRHADELSELKIEDNDPATELENESEPEKRLSKAQRRREKKCQDEKEREAHIKLEEELNKDSPRNNEIKKIKEILKARKLAVFPISSDGDCLYNAVKHQLSLRGACIYNTSDLRKITAEYIEESKDVLIFYMENPKTNEILTDDEFQKYCDTVRNTKAWGGEIEVKALSHKLRMPIEVLQATGPSTIHGAGEFDEDNLVITYHRHMYSLGEHYNSTQPLSNVNEDELDGKNDEFGGKL